MTVNSSLGEEKRTLLWNSPTTPYQFIKQLIV